MLIRSALLFFCLFKVCADAMVPDVVNLRELPPAYVRVHEVLSTQVLQAQADHLLEKSLSDSINIGDIQSDAGKVYKHILETGYDNYFSCALSFITQKGEMITIFPAIQCGRVIISRNDDPILLDSTTEIGMAVGDMTGIYSIDKKNFVFFSGAKSGSTDYVRTFAKCCPVECECEKILVCTSLLDKRIKDSEKLCFDLLAMRDSLDFFIRILQGHIEADDIVTDVVFNGSGIRSACYSCLGALGILQRLGSYAVRGVYTGERAGFFAAIYKRLLDIDKVDTSCGFSSVISYIMPYPDSEVFFTKEGELQSLDVAFATGTIVQLHLQETFFLESLVEVVDNSMPPMFRKLLLEDISSEQITAAKLLSDLCRGKLKTLIDWLHSQKVKVYTAPSDVRVDVNRLEMEDLFDEDV